MMYNLLLVHEQEFWGLKKDNYVVLKPRYDELSVFLYRDNKLHTKVEKLRPKSLETREEQDIRLSEASIDVNYSPLFGQFLWVVKRGLTAFQKQ